MNKAAWTLVFCLVALVPTSVLAAVGFFSPDGLHRSVVQHAQIGLFNGEDASQIERNLDVTKGTPFKAFVDLGPIIARPANPSSLNMHYVTFAGKRATKLFAPQRPSYLRVIPSDAVLRRVLAPIMVVLSRHAANVGVVFLADEPYLHGISKSELERAAKLVRQELDRHGLAKVKIGAIFASGMFDPAFARLMNREAGAYVERIDNYDRSHGNGAPPKAFAAWVSATKRFRLVTYDEAGNMYVSGGLPEGFNIYGFDYYLSTLLLDGLHEDSLKWFAQHFPNAGCQRFSGMSMSDIRGQLSFFRNGPVLTGKQYRQADAHLLDDMYRCRMNAVTEMLKREAVGRRAEFLLVSESSNNGVLEFTREGTTKSSQPESLVDARVLDEVNRAQSFYDDHACFYSAGLLYFTYQDVYDETIKLHVGGASDMPAVMASIYHFAAHVGKHKRQSTMPAGRYGCHRANPPGMFTDGLQAKPFPPASLSVTPRAINMCSADQRIEAQVTWRISEPSIRQVKVTVLDPGASRAKLFSRGGYSGKAETGDWVVPGTRFDLINSETGDELATYTVTAEPCVNGEN